MRNGAIAHAAPAMPERDRVVFDEILPQSSGIAWVHENAMSAQHYPPETLGPGATIDSSFEARTERSEKTWTAR